MEICKKRNTKQIVGIFGVVIFVIYIVYTNEAINDFWDALTHRMSEFDPFLSHDVNDVNLLLWTRKNPYKDQILNISSIEDTQNLNLSNPIKILCHGFSDEGRCGWIQHFRNKYLESADVNVISVEWSRLCTSPWYSTASKNAKNVGNLVAQYILKLQSKGVSLDNVHVLGASLGGQLAGFIGHYTGGKVGRITGMDPSGPLFHIVNASDRLDKSDAQFVDIIHTAGRWVGNDDTIGHIDFYPNSGRSPQPGCVDRESVDLTCSHLKSIRMFEETIKDGGNYIAVACNNYEDFDSGICCNNKQFAKMGEKVNRSLRGKYYLNTRGSNPFALPKEESINCVKLDDVI